MILDKLLTLSAASISSFTKGTQQSQLRRVASSSGSVGCAVLTLLKKLLPWLHQVLVAAHSDLLFGCWGFSLVVAQTPEQVDSVAVACRLSCPTACGILGP